MDANEWIVEQFEDNRAHLHAVALRMLGSRGEADDAIQEAWLRLSGAPADINNPQAWLTTVVGRICLNMLRARSGRRDEPSGVQLPDPVITLAMSGPEDDALVADSVGVALLVVLDTLTPAERLAFVLHDIFEVPFPDIGLMLGRTGAAARQLASRARRRVRGAKAEPEPDRELHRQIVDAFFAAARAGDFDALVRALDPDVVAYVDSGRGVVDMVRGAAVVAKLAQSYYQPSAVLQPVFVNGEVGVVILAGGKPAAVLGFSIVGERITAIEAINDRARVRSFALPFGDCPT
jgi:RNA polymerase sigma-70 factor (ECF subfamily)